MSPASPFPEPRRLARALRVAGVLALLAVQGGCGLVVQGIWRLARSVERPSREARHAAALAPGAAQEAVAFPAAMGYVDRFEDDAVVVMTAEAPARVRLDRWTVLRTPEGMARPSDLHPGAGVVVAGEVGPDDVILADVVMIRPAP